MASLSETLRTRVERLERASLRDRAIVFGVVALALVTAQAPSSSSGPQISAAPITVQDALGHSATLTSSGLVVRDASGPRVFAGVDDQNRPSIDLHDKTKGLRESMYLFGTASSPTLRDFDANGKRRLELRVSDAGNPELQISDPNEKLRGALFMGTNGNPQLGLYGSDEKLRAYLSTDDVSPFLVMRDASGQSRVDVGGFTDGTIGMDIRNASNVVLWKAVP
jgi:hypothetical protein